MSRTQGFWNEAAERRSWAEQQEVFGRELRDVVAHAHAHAPAHAHAHAMALVLHVDVQGARSRSRTFMGRA